MDYIIDILRSRAEAAEEQPDEEKSAELETGQAEVSF